MLSVINSLVLCWGQENAQGLHTVNLPISYTTNYINVLSYLTTGYAAAANISPVNVYKENNTVSSFQVFIESNGVTGINWITIGY